MNRSSKESFVMNDFRERPSQTEEREQEENFEEMRQRRYLRSRSRSRSSDEDDEDTVSTRAGSRKKMTGPGFYLIVGIALIKDIADILAAATVVFVWLPFVTTPIVAFIVGFYLFYSGVRLDTRKVATGLISFAIDLIPVVSVLPSYTLMLFVIRWLENNKGAKLLTRFQNSK